jgi:hypothetical protein
MGGDEAALHQIAALNEALTLAVSLLRVAVGAHGGRTNEMIEVWKLIKSLR